MLFVNMVCLTVVLAFASDVPEAVVVFVLVDGVDEVLEAGGAGGEDDAFLLRGSSRVRQTMRVYRVLFALWVANPRLAGTSSAPGGEGPLAGQLHSKISEFRVDHYFQP
jgi:hypothetical protein